ncbi:hypothetical protein GCM10023075_09460 [Streptosporangium album]
MAASQRRWLEGRRYLNRNRAALAAAAYDRYTSAVRYMDPPTLFENRPSYRLLDLRWSSGQGEMTFGLANYFDKLDVSEAVGHETAAAMMKGQTGLSWEDLPFRALIRDPFGFHRRAVIPAITTLMLRRRRADEEIWASRVARGACQYCLPR